MTLLTTAAAATRTVRVIRSPPGSQLQPPRFCGRVVHKITAEPEDFELQLEVPAEVHALAGAVTVRIFPTATGTQDLASF